MGKIFFSLAALLLASTANAQLDTIQGRSLDEVVVTANKYPQKQSTTGKVITVIPKEEIEKHNGRTLSQLLNDQAGVVINGALNNLGSVQTTYVRGAASGRTLILLDGVPLNDPSMINNEFDLNLFSLDNIERIEICKGAQSTLYGSDAIAGVINIITVNPNVNKPFNVKATLSEGNLGTLKSNVQLFGKYKKLNYSLRHARIYSNGFSAAYDSTGVKNFDRDKYNGNNTQVQLNYELSSALSLKTYLLNSRYEAGLDAGTFRDEKDFAVRNSTTTGGAGFVYRKGKIALNGTYQFSKMDRNFLNDSLFRTSTIFEDNQYDGKTHFAELYASTKFSKNFTLLTGIDYRKSAYEQLYLSRSIFGPYELTVPKTDMHQSAAYTSLNFSSSDQKLNIELGGRVNKHSKYGTNYTYTFNPSYSVNSAVRIFGSIATGFKAPTLYQLSINDALEAEKSINYEAGLQYRNERFSSRLVGFHRNINNGIDYNYITFQYFNYVKQVVSGIELEATFSPLKKLTLTGNYTYLGTRETTQNRATNKDTITYNYLLRRPAHLANVTIAYSPTSKLYISLSGKYVGDRYDIGGYQRPDLSLEAYFLANAHASYQVNEHVKLFADVQNIGNTQFFDVYGFTSIPRLYNAGVILNW